MTQPTKVAGTLRRAVRNPAFAGILGERDMGCAYYFGFCQQCPFDAERKLNRYLAPIFSTDVQEKRTRETDKGQIFLFSVEGTAAVYETDQEEFLGELGVFRCG